jgi:hypothetical protein
MDRKLTNLAWTVKKLNVEAMDKQAWCMVDGVNYTSASDNDLDGGTNPTDPEDSEGDTGIEEVEEDVEYVEDGPNEDNN